MLCIGVLIGAALVNFILTPECSFIGLFILWRNRNAPPLMGNESLVGMSGTVERPFVYGKDEQFPIGYVRVNGELWKAHIPDAEDLPRVGTSVTIEAVNGLVLTVKP